ncbi:MAG: condensation domain-containing protein, partial [Anaerolineae bacterium]
MRIVELLGVLRARDIALWADGGTLRYSAPAGALTPHLRALLADRKAELLELLRSIEAQAPAISQVSLEGALPLSFAQERLWFLDQLEPGNPVYNIPMALRLIGNLDVEALESSLNEIVRRHEVLRTTFVAQGGVPSQAIAPPLSLNLPIRDLEGISGIDQETEVQRLATEEAQCPFDLSRGPLLRCALLRLQEQEHVLLSTMHHIVSDGWSRGVFLRELSTLYGAFRAGRPSGLPELPVQYADYAVWQREWLQGEVLEAQLSYWRRQLSGAPTVLDLPTDRPRPAVQSFSGARQSERLSAALYKRLNALSREEDVTLFMTLLAAFNVILHRYTGAQDILVGTPIANRNRAEIEGLIGFFANTLVLRGDLSGDPTFRELLARVRETCLDAYAHQDLPFEKLVEELQPTRSLSHAPIFQVMFALQNVPRRALELSGLEVSQLAVGRATAMFDLSLVVFEAGAELRLVFEFNTDLFDATTIGRMRGHLLTLLRGILADPDERISRLELLTEADRHQLIVAWNEMDTDYPEHLCVHQLFEAQVERTPEAAALRFAGRELTYRELNYHANQVAHYLRGRGVGPETL